MRGGGGSRKRKTGRGEGKQNVEGEGDKGQGAKRERRKKEKIGWRWGAHKSLEPYFLDIGPTQNLGRSSVWTGTFLHGISVR